MVPLISPVKERFSFVQLKITSFLSGSPTSPLLTALKFSLRSVTSL